MKAEHKVERQCCYLASVKARAEAFNEAAKALVGVARAYRAKYGRSVEKAVCLPLADGIEAIRALASKPEGA